MGHCCGYELRSESHHPAFLHFSQNHLLLLHQEISEIRQRNDESDKFYFPEPVYPAAARVIIESSLGSLKVHHAFKSCQSFPAITDPHRSNIQL